MRSAADVGDKVSLKVGVPNHPKGVGWGLKSGLFAGPSGYSTTKTFSVWTRFCALGCVHVVMCCCHEVVSTVWSKNVSCML